MRVTDMSVRADVLANVNDSSARLQQTTNELSSGYSIIEPSDNPVGASQAVGLLDAVAQTTQYSANVTSAQGFASSVDTALSQGSQVSDQIYQYALEAANSTTSPTGRSALVSQINDLVDALKNEGNAQYGDQYVFSGGKTSTAPYQSGTNDTYQGDSAPVNREIGPGTTVNISVTAQQAFGDSSTGIIAAARQITADLTTGTTASLANVGGSDLAALQAGMTQLQTVQAQIGGVEQQLNLASSRLSGVSEDETSNLSDVRDADVATLTIDYNQQQAAYQAALQTGANLMEPSLANYISS
jgi:flagellar hook-associated protein 3 FlgL